METLNITLAQIPSAAKQLAKRIKGGDIFALVGPLGAGKTTFVRAVGKELKIKHLITSPTFTLLNCFPAKLNKNRLMLYHLDLYRTKNFKEAESLGLTEFWGKNHTITFIEWADKIKKYLPKKSIMIKFSGK